MGRRNTRRQKKAQRNSFLRNKPLVAVTVLAVFFIATAAFILITREEPGQKFRDEGHTHLDNEPGGYIWDTRPPTSGSHAPNIAGWGESSTTIPEWLQIHNLEEGGLIFHYNCPDACPEIVDGLRDIIRDRDLEEYILQPNANMDTRIAVTAWTRLLALDEIDPEQINNFIGFTYGIDHHR